MKDTVRNIIANIAQTMASDPEFEFLVGFWNFPGQVGYFDTWRIWAYAHINYEVYFIF